MQEGSSESRSENKTTEASQSKEAPKFSETTTYLLEDNDKASSASLNAENSRNPSSLSGISSDRENSDYNPACFNSQIHSLNFRSVKNSKTLGVLTPSSLHVPSESADDNEEIAEQSSVDNNGFSNLMYNEDGEAGSEKREIEERGSKRRW